MSLELEHISSESVWSVEAEKTNRNNLKLSAAVQQQSEKPNVIPYFESEAALLASIPSPTQGMQAWVGTLYPGIVWNYSGSSWSNTGQVPNVSEQDLSEYAKTGGYDGTLETLNTLKADKELLSKLQPDGVLKRASMLYYIGGYDGSSGSIVEFDENLHKTSGYIRNKVGDRIKVKGAYTVTSYDSNMQNRQTNIAYANMADKFAIHQFTRDGYFAINYEFSSGHNIANKIGDVNNILVAFYPANSDIVENKVDKIAGSRLITEQEAAKVAQIDNLINKSKNLIVRKIGGDVFIRSEFNKTKDIVRRITTARGSNGASNLLATYLLNKDANIESIETLIHDMNDTAPAPFQMHTVGNTTTGYMNIAGNHGIASVADINSPNHGKTNSDLWSIWRGANDVEVYLVEILDANNLRYACKPYIDVDGFDKIQGATSPLVHVSGATNTDNITFTGSLYEYKPTIRSIEVKVYADNVEIIEDGDYNCDELKIIDKHLVADPTQITIQTPYFPYNNGAMIENTIVHRFTKYAYISELLPSFKKSHKARNISAIQPQCLTKGVYTGLKAFTMNVNAKNGYDFDLGVDLTATISSGLYIYKSDLKDQGKHYQQLSEILYNEGSPVFGMGSGYLPFGTGKSENQIANSTIFNISNAKKYYPYGKTGIVALNEIPRCSGFISYFDASVNPDLSMCFLVPYSTGYLLYLKLIGTITNKTVYLPKEALNREFEMLWDGNITVITDDYTTNEGLIISGNVGDYCVLKIK